MALQSCIQSLQGLCPDSNIGAATGWETPCALFSTCAPRNGNTQSAQSLKAKLLVNNLWSGLVKSQPLFWPFGGRESDFAFNSCSPRKSTGPPRVADEWWELNKTKFNYCNFTVAEVNVVTYWRPPQVRAALCMCLSSCFKNSE